MSESVQNQKISLLVKHLGWLNAEEEYFRLYGDDEIAEVLAKRAEVVLEELRNMAREASCE